MKNFKLLLVAVLAILSVSSCMKNEYVDDNSFEENQARIDSILKKQKPILAAYALDSLGEGRMYSDTLGIWYEVLEEADPEDDFEYVIRNSSYIPVVANVKYKGQLLTGEVFDQKTTSVEQEVNNVILGWLYAFYPKSSDPGQFSGLLPEGLKKGSKIRIVIPSPLGYDNQVKEKIPANSPLDFTIEVTSIRNSN